MRFHKPVHPSQQPHLQGLFQGGIPDDGGVAAPNSIAVSSGSYDDGGVIQNPLNHILSLGTQNIPKIPQQPTRQPDIPIYGPSQQQAGPQRSSDAGDTGSGDGGSYDDGGTVSPDNGTVNPDAFLQWPAQVPPQGFDDGGTVYQDEGQVDPNAFLDPTGLTDPATAQLAQHSRDVYDGIHSKLENAWHKENGGLGSDDDADEQGGPPDNDTDDQGLARGGLVTPPGPAGPGVKPQAPTGNAGRPNFTAPDPARVSAEKNYAQNVTSRPATSPARGTSFSQPGPDGGQRGQEWYGKGNSPYGKGRKTKNG
jgi:hypothetical protein